MEKLQVKLFEVTGVDVREQELLVASGQTVQPKTLVIDCIKNDQVGKNWKSSSTFLVVVVVVVVVVSVVVGINNLMSSADN